MVVKVNQNYKKNSLKSTIALKARMFWWIVISLFFTQTGNSQQVASTSDYRFLKEVSLLPSKLKLEGDSIKFSLKGSIPVESVLIPRNPRLNLIFKATSSGIDLGEISLTKTVSSLTYEKKFSLKYESWMEGATLELNFFQGNKKTDVPFESRNLAKGVIAPQLMVRLGEVYPDEAIPQVGLYILTGEKDSEMEQREEFSFLFNVGTATLKPGTENAAVLKRIEEFLKRNPNVVDVKITGIQSPESAEEKNSQLGSNRAKSIGQNLISRFPEISESKITYESRWKTWFDFRILLGEYRGISTQRKDELYAVLLNDEPYPAQSARLKKVPGFSQASSDLFPKLRSVKVEITSRPLVGLDMEQTIKLREALSKPEMGNTLSFGEWALAAEASQSLEEKALIYSKMTELFRSPLPYNNMAVVRMRQAQRTLDQGSKEVLWEEAERLLEQAFRIASNPYALHNQGQILALKGEHWEAYKKLSEASGMTKKEEFIKSNELLRGALDILRGDYKLATLRFDFKITDPKDLFNKGLAYYMVGDYAMATVAFEESVIQGRSFGYGYYGLAMIAMQTGQGEIAAIHLKNAIDANKKLKEKAYLDPVFEELSKLPYFFDSFSN